MSSVQVSIENSAVCLGVAKQRQDGEFVMVGESIVTAGTLATLNGERQINASDVAIVSSGNPLPEPLGSLRMLSAPASSAFR